MHKFDSATYRSPVVSALVLAVLAFAIVMLGCASAGEELIEPATSEQILPLTTAEAALATPSPAAGNEEAPETEMTNDQSILGGRDAALDAGGVGDPDSDATGSSDADKSARQVSDEMPDEGADFAWVAVEAMDFSEFADRFLDVNEIDIAELAKPEFDEYREYLRAFGHPQRVAGLHEQANTILETLGDLFDAVDAEIWVDESGVLLPSYKTTYTGDLIEFHHPLLSSEVTGVRVETVRLGDGGRGIDFRFGGDSAPDVRAFSMVITFSFQGVELEGLDREDETLTVYFSSFKGGAAPHLIGTNVRDDVVSMIGFDKLVAEGFQGPLYVGSYRNRRLGFNSITPSPGDLLMELPNDGLCTRPAPCTSVLQVVDSQIQYAIRLLVGGCPGNQEGCGLAEADTESSSSATTPLRGLQAEMASALEDLYNAGNEGDYQAQWDAYSSEFRNQCSFNRMVDVSVSSGRSDLTLVPNRSTIRVVEANGTATAVSYSVHAYDESDNFQGLYTYEIDVVQEDDDWKFDEECY